MGHNRAPLGRRRWASLATVVVVVLGMLAGGWVPSAAAATPLDQFYGVSCGAARDCVAVGLGPGTLAESWNGLVWSVQDTPAPSGSSASSLFGVSCVTRLECFAVGQSYADQLSHTLVERSSGARWSLESSPDVGTTTSDELSGISCDSVIFCMAVGSSQANVNSPGTSVITSPLAERWNGSEWQIVDTPHLPGSGGGLHSVSCTGPNHCTAVGANDETGTPLIERWNGTDWRTQEAAPGTSGTLNGVSCSGATNCTAVGSNTYAFIEHWGGGDWRLESSLAFEPALWSVSCVAADYCNAVGSGQPEDWNGSRWRSELPPVTHGQDDSLLGVSCTSSAYCIAVGDDQVSGGYLTVADEWNGSAWKVLSPKSPSSSS